MTQWLSNYISIEVKSNIGANALHVAILFHNCRIARWLIQECHACLHVVSGIYFVFFGNKELFHLFI